MTVWTPALTQTLITIVGFVTVSIVALGQWQIARQRGWREVAESSESLIKSLQEQLEEAKRERQVLEERFAAAVQKHQADIKLMEARIVAWETQLAHEQRINYQLQQRLDQAEARHAKIDARAEAHEVEDEVRHGRNEARNERQHPKDHEE